ncbi:hypothetical protein BJF79_24925 [Actinomadura sp. CNU-125]|nr:hypothetical protein BJF79_24925 [Actinomadura sp. CNU-125]
MAADEGAEGLPEGAGVEGAVHADEEADVVGGAVRERPVVQPHALLRVGKGGGSVVTAGGEAVRAGAEAGLRHHPPHQFAPPGRRVGLLLLHAQLFRVGFTTAG